MTGADHGGKGNELRTVYLHFCRGNNIIHRAIRFASHGYWNHAAISLDENDLYESDFGGVVCVSKSKWFDKRKAKGQKIRTIAIQVKKSNWDCLRKALTAKVGLGYDYWALVGFLFRYKPLNREGKFFCSEYIVTCLRETGLQFFHENAEWRITPSELFYAVNAYQKAQAECTSGDDW